MGLACGGRPGRQPFDKTTERGVRGQQPLYALTDLRYGTVPSQLEMPADFPVREPRCAARDVDRKVPREVEVSATPVRHRVCLHAQPGAHGINDGINSRKLRGCLRAWVLTGPFCAAQGPLYEGATAKKRTPAPAAEQGEQ